MNNTIKIFSKKAIYGTFLFGLIIVTGADLALGMDDQRQAIAEGLNKNVVLLVTYVLIALIFSFLCSIAEAVLLSMTPSYIEEQQEKQPRRSALLKKLKMDHIDRSLAAILSLNTIAHTLGAIGAGAQASIIFGDAWFGLFSAAMTLMILFLSEIVPKTIGALYWHNLVWFTTFFVYTLIVSLFPIVWVSEKITKIISRGKTMRIFSRDEFIAMARFGAETGDIRDNESRIIRNLFHLGSLTARDIMTPGTVITSLFEEMTIADAVKQITDKPYSRLPLYKNSIDDITGFVLRDEILLKKAQDLDDETLKSLKRSILVVPATVSVSILLERFLKDRQHIAIVVDEHGGTRGLVTLEDLIETLIGVEIVDEIEKIEDMRVFARKLWKERAKALGIKDDEISG